MLSRSFDASYLQETTFFLSKQVSQGHYAIQVLWEIVQRLFHLNFWFAPKVFVSLGFEGIVDKKQQLATDSIVYLYGAGAKSQLD